MTMNYKQVARYSLIKIYVFIFSISLVAISPNLAFAQEDNSFPSIDIKTLDGENFNTSQLSNNGKPVILCIWEVSCVPCVQEFNNIAEYYDEWQKETGVKVVGISIDDNRNYSRVKPLVTSKGWKFDFYQDKNQDIKRALGISYCPYTVILDSSRSVVWRKGTYSAGDEDVMYEIVKKIAKGEKIDN
jgi:peroxiredoxin